MFVARSKGREKRNVSSRPCAHYFKQQLHYHGKSRYSLAQRLKKGRDWDKTIFRRPAWILNFINSIHSISRRYIIMNCKRTYCWPNDGFREGIIAVVAKTHYFGNPKKYFLNSILYIIVFSRRYSLNKLLSGVRKFQKYN